MHLFQGVEQKYHNQGQFDSHRERVQIAGNQGHSWNKEMQDLFGNFDRRQQLEKGKRKQTSGSSSFLSCGGRRTGGAST